jgi:hypothetical protein
MYHLEDVARTRDLLDKHRVEYLFIGKGAAIIQGFSDTTQDIDIYPLNEPANNARLVAALRELGFDVDPEVERSVLVGKDFIQFRQPFDLDIVFAPDGFESYAEAKLKYGAVHDGYPVLSISGIIHNKKAAGRVKDRESLPRLQSFKEYLDEIRPG